MQHCSGSTVIFVATLMADGCSEPHPSAAVADSKPSSSPLLADVGPLLMPRCNAPRILDAYLHRSLEVWKHAPSQSSQPSCLRFTATSLDGIGWSPPDWSSALFSACFSKSRTVNDRDIASDLVSHWYFGTFLVIGSVPIHTNFCGQYLSSICISFGIACFLERASSIGFPATCVVRSFLLFLSIRA
jgi:hypothetical protein